MRGYRPHCGGEAHQEAFKRSMDWRLGRTVANACSTATETQRGLQMTANAFKLRLYFQEPIYTSLDPPSVEKGHTYELITHVDVHR